MTSSTTQHYGRFIKLSKSSIKSPRLRVRLEQLHRTKDLDLRPVDFKKEMKDLRDQANQAKKLPDWRLLFAISNSLNSIHYPQLFPYYLLDIYAPAFYARFPNGQIYFIESDFSLDNLLYNDNRQTAEKYSQGIELSHGAQVYGLGFTGILDTLGLMLPLLLRYPYVQGIVSSSIGGFLYFVIDQPISMHNVYEPEIRDFLLCWIRYAYADSLSYPQGPPRPNFAPLQFNEFQNYLMWYVKQLNNLADFIFQIQDRETRLLSSFSLARICLDTYIIQLVEYPYIRKILFLNLLDKYANLISELGKIKQNEVDIWKKLLSVSFFKSRLKKLTRKIPRSTDLSAYAEGALTELINDTLYTRYQGPVRPATKYEQEALNYMRNYRNTNHGYLLNGAARRTALLNHSGDIPNYLPDLSYYLWHTLIANPRSFIEAF